MTDNIKKETERIHQGIVESLSFSEALAKRDAEIERLRELLREWVVEENNAECGSEEHAQWYFGFLRRVREALGE